MPVPEPQKRVIVPARLPSTGGPYSVAVQHGSLLFISGLLGLQEEETGQIREARQAGIDPPQLVPPPFEEEVQLALDALGEVLVAAGSSPDCLLKVTVFLQDQGDAERFDRIYRQMFGDYLPARTRLQAGRLPLNRRVEIEGIAYVPDDTKG